MTANHIEMTSDNYEWQTENELFAFPQNAEAFCWFVWPGVYWWSGAEACLRKITTLILEICELLFLSKFYSIKFYHFLFCQVYELSQHCMILPLYRCNATKSHVFATEVIFWSNGSRDRRNNGIDSISEVSLVRLKPVTSTCVLWYL